MNIVKGSSVVIGGVVYTEWTGDISTSTLATPLQMTGAVVKLYVKKRDGDSDANAVFVNAGSVSNINTGSVQAPINASDTNDLAFQSLVYELVVKLSDGTYHRSGVQLLNLKPNVGKTLF